MGALENNLFSKWAVDKISLGTPALNDMPRSMPRFVIQIAV